MDKTYEQMTATDKNFPEFNEQNPDRVAIVWEKTVVELKTCISGNKYRIL